MKKDLFSEAKNFKINAACRPIYEETQRLAKEFLKPTAAMTFSKFEAYYLTGIRESYENEYLKKRGKLNFFAVMVLSKHMEYLAPLEDIIWAICGEFTWALPAHVPDELDMSRYASLLDLFATETAFALSEIYYLLQDVLSLKIKKRLEYEIRRRVIDPFLQHSVTYDWEHGTNNWSAVCAGSVGAVFLYMAGADEEKAVRGRILEALSGYLFGFGDDGACAEGYAYWLYGFGFFTVYASLLRQYTEGEIDLFKNEKVKNIATFQSKIALGDNICVNFSDGSEPFYHRIGLSCFLHREYTEVAAQSNKNYLMPRNEHCYRWCAFIRDFVWADDSLTEKSEIGKGTFFLPDAQWFIHKCESYCFAAKAGGNNESHNHNDAGSFIISKDNSTIISELGCGEYTRDYFNDKYRYNYLVNSSRGHSLPIINGSYQKHGEEYGGEILAHDEKNLEMQIGKAYEKGVVKSLVRSFACLENSVIMTDAFEFETAPESVVERLVSTKQPVISDRIVCIDDCVIEYDSENFSCEISSEEFTGHRIEARRAYFIDFTAKHPSKSFSFKTIINLK